MKLLRAILFQLMLLSVACPSFASPGFFLPEDVEEITIHYRSIRNLIVLPVMVNKTPVNLILDTGCRSLVLFGRKFQKALQVDPGSHVEFSGLGSGKPVTGKVSLMNTVSIGEILGNDIAVVVVSSGKLFPELMTIDGVIGYDVFYKFEIVIDTQNRSVTFRAAENGLLRDNFHHLPLRIVETRPVIDSKVSLEEHHNTPFDLMIDTGSAFGLLVKTGQLNGDRMAEVIGKSFNGNVIGYTTISPLLDLSGHLLINVPAGVIRCKGTSFASIGMDVLKDYIIVINYLKQYVALKRWNAGG